MTIRIYAEDPNLKQVYVNASAAHINKMQNDPRFCDSGFDMYLPCDTEFHSSGINKVDFGIKCCASIMTHSGSRHTGFYTYARSSISKTPLRLANNQGIIDAGYRGNLIGMFDLLPQYSEERCHREKASTRLLQICAPNLVPVWPVIVDSLEELGTTTQRGEGGFGSTNV